MSNATCAVPSSLPLFPVPPEEVAGRGTEVGLRMAESPCAAVAREGMPAGVLPASRLGQRPAPPTVPVGIPPLDELTGGLPRGGLSEFCGPASSGRTSVLLAAMAECTRRQEVCALVDAGDSFDPASAAAAGVDLRRLLWVRCGGSGHRAGGRSDDRRRTITRSPDHPITRSSDRPLTRSPHFRSLEQALKATDLLLQGGGFGMVIVDLGDVPPLAARRIPLTSWFRFRRAVEHTPTVLLVLEEEPWAKSCASLLLQLSAVGSQLSESRAAGGPRTVDGAENAPSHARLFQGLRIQAEVLRARGPERKPVRPAASEFESSTAWRIA